MRNLLPFRILRQSAHLRNALFLGTRWMSNQVPKPGRSMEELYSETEQSHILTCLNQCSAEELQLTRQLSLQKATAIVKFRAEHGNFQWLSDCLKVPGIGLLTLQKVCTILKTLEPDSLQKMKEKKDYNFVRPHPPLSVEDSKKVKSLVAMEIDVDKITWTKMGRNLEVEDWRQTMIFDKIIQKFDHVRFLEQVMGAVDQLPKADLYVTEGKTQRIPNLRMVPYLVNLRTVEAMVITLLNRDLLTTGQHSVYATRPHTVRRFFGLGVGGEQVSGQHLLRGLTTGRIDPTLEDVSVPGHLWPPYFSLTGVQQEKFCNSFLLATAFYKLIVFRTHTLS